MQPINAWLLDLYPQRGDMVLWFIAETGERLRLLQSFTPSFFIDAENPALFASDQQALLHTLKTIAGFEAAEETERTELWSGRARRVLEVRVTDLNAYAPNLTKLNRRWPGLRYYNCDILPEIAYGYETGIFPTALCSIEHAGGRLLACRLLDEPNATDYQLPPLRKVTVSAENPRLQPLPSFRSLTLTFEERSWTWDGDDPGESLLSFRDVLNHIDPDLIWTHGGDSLLMPVLLALAQRCRIDLRLDREPAIERKNPGAGTTYISYGQILYRAPDYPLFGRWHIDADNSFWSSETGLAGLVEVARMSKLPVQRAARRSIGTGISSIQLNWAWREKILIPWKKTQPEAWKTAATLLKSDRGGLVYQPITGVYEDVVELDFVAMYPSIMARRNVSPETINCSCCPPSPDVPELDYTVCRQRKGLVSRALAPIIEKRVQYKAMMREPNADPADIAAWDGRQSALKWLLVCCFGYLGYRNARFGRIEAHESTCAFSRELLLRAKDVAEARGFEIIHAIVDCFWLRKPGVSDREVADLCAEIELATKLPIAIEGRYRWIAFLPSRPDPERPVPNRYFGCFENGKLKFRGIEVRRGDQAPFIREFQRELLDRLTRAGSLAECRAMREELTELVRDAQERLRCHEITPEDLLLNRTTSMTADEYRGNGMTAVAARQAKRARIDLHAGEAVSFLVTSARDRDVNARLRLACLLQPDDAYDSDYYIEQLRRAAATVLEPLLGEPLEHLLNERQKPKPPLRRTSKRIAIEPEPTFPLW